MDENQYYTIILRHDTSTMWMTNDPILRLGELGVEDDTHKVKRGDGESKWSELSYEDFGLTYIVTFENLHGDIEKNDTLVEEFNKKISKETFEDVNNKVVASLVLSNEEDGEICRITRLTKNIETNGTAKNVLQIYSSDNSLQGYWSITDDGAKRLDLVARSAIKDYEPTHTYFKDQICYYGNKLYRAYQDLVAGPTFNTEQWVLLSSLHSNDIKYDNLLSGLDSDNVKDALDELKRRDDRKVQKSTEERVVYGTDNSGNQTVIPIDDLRKVDTVNHKKADLSKNVQLDASEINYSDADPSLGTIRKVLDSKVDKVFAGQGARIVRDVQFEYNEVTGHITLIEDKVSPEDGSSATEEREIDVVSERELANESKTINDRIDTEVATINNRMDTEVETLNTRIDDEVATINNRMDTEVATINTRMTNEVDILNNTINTKETEIYNKIQEEHDEINDRVDTEVTTLNTRMTNEVETINNRIDDEVETLNNTITEKETNLQEQIDENKAEISRVESESKQRDLDIRTRLDNEVETLDNRITDEVGTLNETINNKETAIYEKITEEHNEINERVDTEVETLNTTITEKETILDTKKIDKDIAETIVTDVKVSTHDSQPTIKVTNKNTDTKTANYDYVHFGTKGNIRTEMEDEDHIIIDSTEIDTINTQQNARLTNAENRLSAHDTQIASLLEHDVNHDKALAQHSNQIAIHETRIETNEDNIEQLQKDLETEAGTRLSSDNALSGRITTNAVAITTKADRKFAQDTDNKVVGKLESDEISGDILLNLKETLVSPEDNSASVERIRIISSDGTVVATRDAETGTIDIRTNLDTDVNYFVTTEIINTVIASETELNLDNLTPTDKVIVEVQDIVSDPEGTWGRVKSINNDTNTCIVVTFKKHAQAVWGTIKGNIQDQADLQNQFTQVNNSISDETTARESADQVLQEHIHSEAEARELNDSLKLDKVNDANVIYGTDENGNQKVYAKDSFGKVDKVNGIPSDENKNVTIDATNIDGGFKSGDLVDCDVNSILDYLDQTVKDLQMQLNLQILDYNGTINDITPVTKFITYTRDDGVMLMAMNIWDGLWSFSNTEPTVYENFMKDVENGYMKLVGIPEQTGDNITK